MRRAWRKIRVGLVLIWCSSSLTRCWIFPSLPSAPTRTNANTAPVPSKLPRSSRLCAVPGDFENDSKGESTESSCLPPGRNPDVKRIFLISDATGVTSRSILLKSLAQFDTCADEKAPYGAAQDDDEDYTSTAERCDVRTRCVVQ